MYDIRERVCPIYFPRRMRHILPRTNFVFSQIADSISQSAEGVQFPRTPCVTTNRAHWKFRPSTSAAEHGNQIWAYDLFIKQEFKAAEYLCSLHDAIPEVLLISGDLICAVRRQSWISFDRRRTEGASIQFLSAQPQLTDRQSLVILRRAESRNRDLLARLKQSRTLASRLNRWRKSIFGTMFPWKSSAINKQWIAVDGREGRIIQKSCWQSSPANSPSPEEDYKRATGKTNSRCPAKHFLVSLTFQQHLIHGWSKLEKSCDDLHLHR
jgi:hypothetical protein